MNWIISPIGKLLLRLGNERSVEFPACAALLACELHDIDKMKNLLVEAEKEITKAMADGRLRNE